MYIGYVSWLLWNLILHYKKIYFSLLDQKAFSICSDSETCYMRCRTTALNCLFCSRLWKAKATNKNVPGAVRPSSIRDRKTTPRHNNRITRPCYPYPGLGIQIGSDVKFVAHPSKSDQQQESRPRPPAQSPLLLYGIERVSVWKSVTSVRIRGGFKEKLIDSTLWEDGDGGSCFWILIDTSD